MQFYLIFLHVFRHFCAKNKTQKNKFWEKCFDNVVSDLCKNGLMCLTNDFEKTRHFQVF